MTDKRLPFVRMNGIGNEILIVDARRTQLRVSPEGARTLAKPQALPFDQIMEISDPAGSGRDYDMRIFNNDGSQAQACGNGTRCVAAWLREADGRDRYMFDIAGGRITANLEPGGRITVDMGEPRVGWQDIPLAEEFGDTTGIELQIGPVDAPVLHTPCVVSMGNPHAVFWVEDGLESYELDRFGPLLENHPVFPEGANISIARILAPDHIQLRTWERGAGLTLACGSAACAALVCAVRKGLAQRTAVVSLPGGDLFVEWTEQNRVLMSGPVEFEFSGRLDPQTGAFERDVLVEDLA